MLDSSLRSIFGLNHLLVLSLGLANAIDTAEQCFPRVDCSLQRHEFFDGVEEFAEVDIMARRFDWFCLLDLCIFGAATAATHLAVDRGHGDEVNSCRANLPLEDYSVRKLPLCRTGERGV